MRAYESIFVLKPELNDKKVDEQVEKVKGLIKKNGGKVVAVEKWGKKKLAYLIKKNRFGIYIFLCFESEPAFISNLQRNYKLNEDIIRYMTVLHREIAKKAPPKEEDAGQGEIEAVKDIEDDISGGVI